MALEGAEDTSDSSKGSMRHTATYGTAIVRAVRARHKNLFKR